MSQSQQSQLDRRNFLSQATGAAVAGAAALTATQRAQAASAASRKVVLGVMGLSRGRALAIGFSKLADVEIKYCCDADIDRAQRGAEELSKLGTQSPQAVQDYRRILDDKSVDGLVCAAPNHWHAPATILGCNAGKHVYVEKPCSHNPWEGETMVAAARKAQRAVQLGTQRRSGTTMQEAITLLHEGAIGRVYEARTWYDNRRGSIGKGEAVSPPKELNYDLWQGPAPRTDYLSNRIHYNWHWFWDWGNGELGNNGVHGLDICRWGLDVDYPIHVASTGGRFHFEDDQQTPDTHTVGYVFPGKKSITWQGHSCNRHPSGGFCTFYGTEGTMEVDSNGGYKVFDGGGKQTKEQKGTNRGDAEHLLDFVTAIREDTPLDLNGEIAEGHKSTLLCHLGNIAHRVGRTLHCDDSNGHIHHDDEAAALWKRQYEPGWEPKI